MVKPAAEHKNEIPRGQDMVFRAGQKSNFKGELHMLRIDFYARQSHGYKPAAKQADFPRYSDDQKFQIGSRIH